jgi:hypothetical protein
VLGDATAGSELVLAVRRLAADGLEAWHHVVGRGYEGAGWTVEGDGWQRRVSVAPSAR